METLAEMQELFSSSRTRDSIVIVLIILVVILIVTLLGITYLKWKWMDSRLPTEDGNNPYDTDDRLSNELSHMVEQFRELAKYNSLTNQKMDALIQLSGNTKGYSDNVLELVKQLHELMTALKQEIQQSRQKTTWQLPQPQASAVPISEHRLISSTAGIKKVNRTPGTVIRKGNFFSINQMGKDVLICYSDDQQKCEVDPTRDIATNRFKRGEWNFLFDFTGLPDAREDFRVEQSCILIRRSDGYWQLQEKGRIQIW